VVIWPENVEIFRLFTALGTQWRVGAAGATGLDYGVVRETARLAGLGKVTPERFQGLQACEGEALSVWAEQRDRERERGRHR
jgi:hypothetical protein